MVGSLGALLVGPTAATTKVEEDVDGRPPWGVLPAGPVTSTTKVEEDVYGGPLDGDPRAPTINVKNINGAPWEVPELGIRERQPSMLRNVDGGPP
jgi:hypothetical protein